MIPRTTMMIVTLLMLVVSCSNGDGQDTWVKVIGGGSEWGGDEVGNSITRTSDGGILITGETNSNDGDFNGMNKGYGDIFVIKLDTNGDVLWKKTFGGSMREEGNSITTTSDGGILITGYTPSFDGDFEGLGSGGFFVIKLDKDGKVLWKKIFGGSMREEGNSITTTSDGDVLITGETNSNDGDFKGMNKGYGDIFVIKLDTNGDVLWKRTFGGSGQESGQSITTTSDGGILITGQTESNDGDFKEMKKGYGDIFVIKLDTNGDVLWKKTFGGSTSKGGVSITTTRGDGILITGYCVNFLLKLDKDGSVLWKKTFGGTDLDYGTSITTTSDGDVLITGFTDSNDGEFKGTGKDMWNILVVKLDKDGKVLWKKTFGGSEEDLGVSIMTTSDDGILITGTTSSNDGNFIGMNKGDHDIFIMKLDKDGNLKSPKK